MTTLPSNTPFYGGGQAVNPSNVIEVSGAPSTNALGNALGTLAVDNATGTIYGLASKSGGTATWAILGGGSGAVATLTGGSGGAISPSGGNISILGTANQITSTGSAGGHSITFSLPSAVTFPGSATTTTSLTGGTGVTATTGGVTATAGDILASAGDFVATLGDFIADAGNITATLGGISAGSNILAGADISTTAGDIKATAGQLVAGGDTAGTAGKTTFTNGNSTTISTGVGSVKMSSVNAADNAAWIKIYVGATAYWIPAWTTNSP
jgi:hypothetical protein